MKLRITRPDGTVIEAEGTAEECASLLGHRNMKPDSVQVAPTFVPVPMYPPVVSPPFVHPYRWERTWTGDRIYWTGNVSGSCPLSHAGYA